MIKSKLGYGMTTVDLNKLDKLIEEAIMIVGTNYGYVLDYVADKIEAGSYSTALKINAKKRSSYFRMHINDIVEAHM